MAETANVLLAMSAPPYWHSGRTVRQTGFYLLLGLLPAVLSAMVNWGLPALRVMALAVCTCVLVEAICEKLMGRDLAIDDCSSAASGLMLAFLLPASAPWWLVILGAVLAIGLGKMAFGGLGANPLNIPLVGWAILAVSFPILMDANATQLDTSFADPLVGLRAFGVDGVATPISDLLLGHQIGGLGASQAGALILGGVCLVLLGVVRWLVCLGFFAAVAGLAWLFACLGLPSPALAAGPLFHLCTGTVLLGGFFLASEPGTAPLRPLPMLLYGLVAGSLVMIIRAFGSQADGFAILLANLLTPYLDMIRPKPFGGR